MVETTATTTKAATTTAAADFSSAGTGFGRLLDLADLDGYLLSLLSPDLTDVFYWAKTAKKAIEDTIWNRNNTTRNAPRIASTPSSSSSPSPLSWWIKLEDLLAVATIWASNGQTPGATALGFDVSETKNQNHPPNKTLGRRRFSFWAWLLGSIRSSNSNSNNNFREKLFLYAILRIVLPRLYETLKSKGLEYIDIDKNQVDDNSFEPKEEDQQQQLSLRLRLRPQQPKRGSPQRLGDDTTEHGGCGETNDGDEDGVAFGGTSKKESPDPLLPSEAEEARAIAALAVHRRKLVTRTVLRWLDGVVLPSMRLALLVACWTGHDSGHGGNLALWLSGLSYKSQQQQQPPSSSKPTEAAASSQAAIIPLHVMFAHWRWFHRESMELLWNRIGRGLLGLQVEISELRSVLGSSLRNEWRMWVLKWSYRRHLAVRKIRNIRVLRSVDKNDDDDAANTSRIKKLAANYDTTQPCQLCGTEKILVPYRLSECCGHIVCYTCLWERLASTATGASSSWNRNTNPATFPCPICYHDIQKCEPI